MAGRGRRSRKVSLVERVRLRRRGRVSDLQRSSAALVLTTGINGVLGLGFWIVAAHVLPTAVVGLGAGAISALQLVGTVGWCGLQYTLMRYLPIAGSRSAELVVRVYCLGGVLATGASIGFLWIFADDLGVGFLSSSPVAAAAFVLAAIAWVIFSLQDAALVGIRRAIWVPLENAAFGLLKLAGLGAFAVFASVWAIVTAWMLSCGVMVLVITTALWRRFLVRSGDSSRLPDGSQLLRFSAGHTAVNVAGWLPDFLVPLLVLALVGRQASAYYYAAWTVAFAARMAINGLASALTVEAAYAEEDWHRLRRSAVRLGALVVVPAMGTLLIGSSLLLQVFGDGYAVAAPVLRLFALSLPASAIIAFFLARDRVLQGFASSLLVTFTATGWTIGLDLLLLPRYGMTGAGVGWLLGQCAACAVAMVVIRRRPSPGHGSSEGHSRRNRRRDRSSAAVPE